MKILTKKKELTKAQASWLIDFLQEYYESDEMQLQDDEENDDLIFEMKVVNDILKKLEATYDN